MQISKKLTSCLNPTEASYLQQLLSNPTERLTLFSEIELTETEIAEALINAKSEKQKLLQYEKNEEDRKKKSQEILAKWDYLQLIEYCKNFYLERFNKEFIIDSRNEMIVHTLAKYFTDDEEFEKAGYSLQKGIMIMGGVGTGKTELMRFFQKNKKRCFAIKPCIPICEEFLIYKDEIDIIYSTPIKKPYHDPSVFFQGDIGYCFDDLGTEEIKNDYGNKKNVMADVLMAVYSKKQFYKFHITTNMSGKEEIEGKYGTRVNSRMREMFNVFVLNGEDRRV